MRARWQIASILLCALALIIATRPAQVVAKSPSAPDRVALARQTAPPVEARHLYVLDSDLGAVYGFPLRAGIPQSKPDILVTSGRAPWSSVAVDSTGYVYVGEGGDPGGILVFARGAHGRATPVRVLKGHYYPWAIALDRDGYLYASLTGTSNDVLVFAPGANGTDPPVQVIPLPAFPEGIAVDPTGNHLYVNDVAGIDVVADPRTAPRIIRTLRPTKYDTLFVLFSLGLWQNELYAQFEPFAGVLATDIAVLPTAGNPPTISPRDGRTRSMRRIYSKSCQWQPYGIIPGIVANERYLYVACGSPSAIFVYDRLHGGYENPVAAIHGPFLSAGEVALGP